MPQALALPFPALAEAAAPAGRPVAETAELALLRRLATRTRLARRTEPETACALLRAEPAQEAGAYGEALLRLLPRALGRRVTLHPPGAQGVSFDEAWLLGLIAAVRSGDADRLVFALASRVEARLRGQIRFLADGFARRIDTLGPETI